jgi:hypothetical protein
MVRGPNGHRSNGSEIEGRPDPRLETREPNRGARRGLDGMPDGVPDEAGRGARRVARRGGQTGCPTGPDGCHVIGHVIFECHVTRLGWQGVILLPTLVGQH